jgi:predicted ATPase
MSEPYEAVWAARYRIIILEGCDGVGKTTCAANLAAHHGFRIQHAARSPEGTDLYAKYQTVLTQPGPLVLDRSFVSELVYGPLAHGRSRLSFAQAAGLAAAAAERDGVLIHLTGQAEQVVARLLARDGHAPPPSRIRALTAAYADVVARLAAYVPVITVSTTASAA